MKKLFVLFILPFFMFTYQIKMPSFSLFFEDVFNKTFCYVFDKNISFQNFVSVKNGGYFFVYFDSSAIEYFENFDPLYRQVTFEGTIKMYKNLLKKLNLKNLISDKLEDVYVSYGFKPELVETKIVFDKKINFQITFSNKQITAGYPMIFGSF